MRAVTLAICVALGRAQLPGAPGNMNGAYHVASGGNQDVPHPTDYQAKGYQYFDVWSPEIATTYGQNFWTDLGNNPLPADIVQKFKGKAIAIVGYEQDQVMVTPTGQPGVNPEKDVSVPINWAYNHHYVMWVTGTHSEMKYVKGDPNDGTHEAAVGKPTRWRAVDKPSARLRSDPSLPTSQFISEGNGGESRRSYHGYPKGYAQLVDGPDAWHMTPMQIDTRDRKCGVTPADVDNCTDLAAPGYVRPPEPKQARYGRPIPAGGSAYSGVLECPCNSRYGGDPAFYPGARTKIVQHGYKGLAQGTCGDLQGVTSSAGCFAAAAQLGLLGAKNVTVSSTAVPAGCSIAREVSAGAGAEPAFVATFNTNGESAAACAVGAKRTGRFEASDLGVTLDVALDASGAAGRPTFERSSKGVYCNDNKVNVLQEFNMANASDAAAGDALAQCEAFCAGSAQCTACSVDCPGGGPGAACRWAALPQCGKLNPWKGIIAGDVSTKTVGGNATITLTGPADAWFGVGFDAQHMTDSPYTIVVSGAAGNVSVMERQIGTGGTEAEHDGGDLLAPSVRVVSATDAGGVRTVVVTRPFQGLTAKHFTFAPGTPTIPFIAAIGASPTFAYHKAHTSAMLTLTPADGAPTCVCDEGQKGQLCHTNGTQCDTFVKNCNDQPGGLLQQHNPTCNSMQYSGGLRCCGNGRIMLDADQDTGTELLRYHMKLRFWYEEYVPQNASVPAPHQATPGATASHNNLPRYYWQTESNAGEYDVPPAFVEGGETIVGYPGWPAGKPTPGTTCTGTCPGGADCACTHSITFSWESPGMRLLYAGAHCHAPSCLGMKLYRNDTGHEMELVCELAPKYGNGNVTHDKYAESGYIELPPCLWGDDEGLQPSFFIPKGAQMIATKVNNNTHVGHFGEMASWQMRGTPF